MVKAGAKAEGQRVRIPEHMVTKALASAPKKLTLYDRKGGPVIRAWGYNSYFGGGSDCLNVLDHRTGERRRAVLQDVIDAVTLMDALPHLDFIMSAFLPSDVSERVYPQYQMEVMLTKSNKPIVFVTPDFETCVACVEMAEIAAGGEEAFRARPFAVCYINVTSGMVANQDSLKKCIYFAEKGLPQLYIPLNAAGVNSPATTAGCMATMNAGTLLGVVLSQLVREGSQLRYLVGTEARTTCKRWLGITACQMNKGWRLRWVSITNCRFSVWEVRRILKRWTSKPERSVHWGWFSHC